MERVGNKKIGYEEMKKTEEQMQAEFEAWYVPEDDPYREQCLQRNKEGNYLLKGVDDAWEVWQACQRVNDGFIAYKDSIINVMQDSLKNKNAEIAWLTNLLDDSFGRFNEITDKCHEQREEIARLRAYIAELEQRAVDSAYPNARNALAARRLRQKNKRLREALSYYTPGNWEYTGYITDITGEKVYEITSTDGGQIAAKALEGGKDE